MISSNLYREKQREHFIGYFSLLSALRQLSCQEDCTTGAPPRCARLLANRAKFCGGNRVLRKPILQPIWLWQCAPGLAIITSSRKSLGSKCDSVLCSWTFQDCIGKCSFCIARFKIIYAPVSWPGLRVSAVVVRYVGHSLTTFPLSS